MCFMGTQKQPPISGCPPTCSWVNRKRTISKITSNKETAPSWTGWWLGHPSGKYESQLGWLATQYMGKFQMATKPPTSEVIVIQILLATTSMGQKKFVHCFLVNWLFSQCFFCQWLTTFHEFQGPVLLLAAVASPACGRKVRCHGRPSILQRWLNLAHRRRVVF